MTNQSDIVSSLRLVLRLNATSCLFCGTAMAIWNDDIARFLGNANSIAVLLIGVGLILNGLHLVFASIRHSLRCYEITYFAIGDFGWVGATIAMITFQAGISTAGGIAVAILIAMMVGSFGFLQTKLGTQAHSEGLLSNQVP